jgi:hypothetical protein
MDADGFGHISPPHIRQYCITIAAQISIFF